MKPYLKTNLFLAALLVILCPLITIAKGGGGNGQGGGMGRGMGSGHPPMNLTPQKESISTQRIQQNQLVNLKRFLALDDKQLQAMIDTLEKIKAMSPKEKSALREKISQFEQLSPKNQEMIRQGWGHASTEDRQAWQQMMRNLPEDERLSIQEKMQSLPFEEKTAFRMQKIKEWKQAQPENSPTDE